MQSVQKHTSADTKPLISFVITYYNRPLPMLRRCLESILAVSLKPEEREIIIVDDGSERSALPNLQPYAKHITYVRQENGGPSDARNTALNVVKGGYTQFVDDDDYLLPKAYNHCVEIARKQAPDVVFFDFIHNKVAQSTYKDAQPISGVEYMYGHNLRGSVWSLLFRNEILHELRFTKGIYSEDDEFTPQLLLRAQSVVETNAKAYFYVKHPNSIINRTDVSSINKRLEDSFYVICSLSDKCKLLTSLSRLAMQRRVDQLTMAYLYNIIVKTHSRESLCKAVQLLQEKELFPLPIRNYSRKYKWFSRIVNTNIGRYALLRLLPLI